MSDYLPPTGFSLAGLQVFSEHSLPGRHACRDMSKLGRVLSIKFIAVPLE